jgi:hypothetical protein
VLGGRLELSKRLIYGVIGTSIWIGGFALLNRFWSPEGILLGALVVLAFVQLTRTIRKRWWKAKIARLPQGADTIRFEGSRAQVERLRDRTQDLALAHGWAAIANDGQGNDDLRVCRTEQGCEPDEMLTIFKAAGLMRGFRFRVEKAR